MDLATDQSTLILLELQELIDEAKECEHATHGDPLWYDSHDDEGAKWFLVGTHSCGRETTIYACNTFVSQGTKGVFKLWCYQCGTKGIKFEDYYKIRTRIDK